MALLASISLSSPTFSQPQCASISMASASINSICRLRVKPVDGSLASSRALRVCIPLILKSRSSGMVRASEQIDGAGAANGEVPQESEKPALSVESLPLESKEQEKLDQKLRMKLAKKIRLRRKRLVRKRQLRKKGRWPPSKMKRLKNV